MIIRNIVILLFTILFSAGHLGLKFNHQSAINLSFNNITSNHSSTQKFSLQNVNRIPIKFNLQAKLISPVSTDPVYGQVFVAIGSTSFYSLKDWQKSKDLNMVLAQGQEKELSITVKTESNFTTNLKDLNLKWFIFDWPPNYQPQNSNFSTNLSFTLPPKSKYSLNLNQNCRINWCSVFSQASFQPQNAQIKYQIINDNNTCPNTKDSAYLNAPSNLTTILNQLPDGVYKICFFAPEEQIINFTQIKKDTTKPISEISNIDLVLTNNSSFTLPITITDNNPSTNGLVYSYNLRPWKYINKLSFNFTEGDGIYYFQSYAVDRAGNKENKSLNNNQETISTSSYYGVQLDTKTPTTNIDASNLLFPNSKNNYDYIYSPIIDITNNSSYLVFDYQSNIIDFTDNFRIEIYDDNNKLLDTVLSTISSSNQSKILYSLAPFINKKIKISFKNYSNISISNVFIYNSHPQASIPHNINFIAFDTGSGLYQTTPVFSLHSGENNINYFSTDLANNIENTHFAKIVVP